ncbi:hypothetical protein F5Y13DRAFT_179959 [Hypoxylon sp. FL1857]|nr:hypothetical protein F5Y13DRAFT_179959 [Hypoxylon sp. FL1857]
MATITKRTVLITGCSDGSLGAALVLAFAKRDFHVFATLRNPAKAGSLASHPNVEVLSLEVTSPSSIASCAAAVGKKTGGKLDILVNNAGIMFAMPMLDTSIEESKKLFDVNVWGMLAVTQAFAPMVIRSKGVILNIASIAGAVRMAWQGVYNSSKACVRWFSETLRIEMQGLDVRVVTAMVGEVETKIYDNAGPTNWSLPASSYYHSVKHLISQQAAGKMQAENEKAEVTAENLVRDVLRGRNGHVWRGGVAGRAKYFHWILPERLFEWGIHVGRGVNQVKTP